MAAEILQINSQDFSSQKYEGQDLNLIPTFEVNTVLSQNSYIEYFTYDINQTLLTSDYNFSRYTVLNNGQSSGQNNSLSQIEIDPEQILIENGFDQGIYITYFNFFNKQIGSFAELLYISEISFDRTEIRLDSTTLSNLDIVEKTNQFIQERENSNYFLDFYLNFGENQLAIANNIVLDNQDPTNPTILVKLYEALPEQFDINSTLWVVSLIEDPIAYQVIFEDEPIVFIDTVNIGGPNFNLDLKDQVNNSTLELSYIDLITTTLTSSQNQLNSLLEEKELDINVDYTSFNNFTHFSSAQTRLENFYYKIQLIEQYSSSIAVLNNTTNSSSSISSSATVYENKINNIITNFDGYEYYLYYETGSTAWPKTNSQKPYILANSTSPTVLTWIGSSDETNAYYGGMLLSASVYDDNNANNLYFSIPEYLREDPTNDQYLLFIDMIGQFYDNIWIYYKDVTEKYNADNRLEYGISKDIVADAIRDFGVKLYQNNFSNEDLYTAFLGLTPEGGLFPFPNITGSLPTPSGFEYVNTLISASNDYLPLDDVNKSLYKRIYHNIPYLLKAKGTLPGLRALITSYGIPDTILRINEYGGKDKVNSNDWDYWQNEFNYAFSTEGNNFIYSPFSPLNPSWDSTNSVPESLMFRFKTNGLPTTNIPYSQSLWSKQYDAAYITLTYTGSGYTSGSYSGSIIDPYYQYATLTFYPSYVNYPLVSASVYLPFFDGEWWSVMVNIDISPSPSYNFTLYAANKIYEGGDNGTLIGFITSSSVTTDGADWDGNGDCYFASSSLVNGISYTSFSGSLQEIRYYTNPISEGVFRDYVMNPYSIEGNSTNSSPNELIFRASLGGELYTGSISIHPKITGSWVTTQSFTSDSNFYFYQTPTFVPNTEYFFYDQPIAGIKNSISDKIRIENNVIPEGDTLSPFMSLSQMANVSQSQTQNINYLEVAFSPANEINEDIMDQIGSFNIGEYIGDPRLRSSSAESYPALDQLRNEYFQKYISNYNLTDFIRLIKFFDNSLFKMIRDFVPARTSLASGVVIKQHLLERNKYPQPQVEWEDLDISGTLKPQWNDYEPGTVEHFEGGAGGVVNPFNYISNTSQSWLESYPTISGSVLILHNSQDEFYNGEYSGSNLVVTTQSLNQPYPQSNQSFLYRSVYYYGSSINEADIFESNFLNNVTSPQNGEILFGIGKSTGFLSFDIYKYLKIAKTDCSGSDNTIVLGNIDTLLIETPYAGLGNFWIKYDVTVLNEQPNYYLYKIDSAKFTINNSNSTYVSNLYPNQVLDYTVSASSAATISPTVLIPLTFASYGSVSGNTLGYFNSTTGIYTLGNTPNTPLLITGSVSIGGIGGTGKFSLNLLRQGNNTVLSTVNVSTGNSYTISSSYYGLQGDQIYLNGSNTGGVITYFSGSLLITQSRAVSASNCENVIFEPYITTPNFYNSDENALLNNVELTRLSTTYQDVDYSAGITEPVNFDLIISGSAIKAAVQDSNYTTKRHIIPRYNGSRSTSQKLNTWTPGDIGTFGKIPTVESLKTYVAYGEMGGSWAPERMNASTFQIKYLISQDGDVLIPNTSENSLSITQGTFQSGELFKISSTSPGSGEATEYRKIIRGGTRIEPILYTQSGSAPGAQWNTTMSFQDIVPSEVGAVGNYTALFNKTTNQTISTTTETLITFNNALYGSSYLDNPNGYQVPLGVIQDGVNLTFDITLNISSFITSIGIPPTPIETDFEVFIYNSLSPSSPISSSIFNFSGINLDEEFNFSYTANNSQLQENAIYQIYIQIPYTPAGYTFRINSSTTKFKTTQYPLFTQPVTSSGINSIWGYVDTTNYPYVITSSNLTLVELYDSNVKQTDISGSGFNSIALPWSIKYADEFRFEGREDFAYQVGKIFGPADSGSARITQTGSIEVHFNYNLPVSASSSVFNLDHFLIRRYVDDASQILFEGFKPINSTGPYIVSPEYIVSNLNKNVDTFIVDLTQKGLL
jgi:hypothetical protein